MNPKRWNDELQAEAERLHDEEGWSYGKIAEKLGFTHT